MDYKESFLHEQPGNGLGQRDGGQAAQPTACCVQALAYDARGTADADPSHGEAGAHRPRGGLGA
jgi:hypothetical protein